MVIKQKLLSLCIFIGLIFSISPAVALKLPLPPKGDSVVGHLQFVKVEPGDDFSKIARRYDVGFYELVESNPETNPDNPAPNTVLIVPTQYILPQVPRKGIVVNLAAMRLYYFPKGKNYFYTYPIGIGKYDWDTPLGNLHIIQKIANPVWIVPDSILKYRQEHGDPVPKVVQAGPDNPLGKFAMRLSKPTYLIHGTNDPASVGRRSSAGCIHLYPRDIKQLFSMIPVGEHVFIMNQPYKVGLEGRKVYIEAHLPLQEQRKELADIPVVVVGLVNRILNREQDSYVNWKKADNIVKEHMGIPTEVGELPPSQ